MSINISQALDRLCFRYPSMLVDAINHRRPSGATENTVLGPFHVPGAPEYPMGTDISLDGKGESCLFTGRVLDVHGNPIEGARIDVWCDNAEGFYDVQQPGIQPQWNNRGIFTTGPDGSPMVGINLRCVEGVDVDKLSPKPWDGRSK